MWRKALTFIFELQLKLGLLNDSGIGSNTYYSLKDFFPMSLVLDERRWSKNVKKDQKWHYQDCPLQGVECLPLCFYAASSGVNWVNTTMVHTTVLESSNSHSFTLWWWLPETSDVKKLKCDITGWDEVSRTAKPSINRYQLLKTMSRTTHWRAEQLLIDWFMFSDEREDVQKKTFTKWVNSQLAKVSPQDC